MAVMEERLEKIFYLIPYVLEHQGVRLNELAEVLDTTEKEVLNYINELFLSGSSEWQQVSVFVDKEKKVFVERADLFTRPLSLTIPEAFSLMLAGNVIKEMKQVKEVETLGGALKKINDAVPEDIRKKTKALKKRGIRCILYFYLATERNL